MMLALVRLGIFGSCWVTSLFAETKGLCVSGSAEIKIARGLLFGGREIKSFSPIYPAFLGAPFPNRVLKSHLSNPQT